MGCPAVVKVTAPGGPAVARVTVPSGPAVVRVAVPGPRGVQGEQGEPGEAGAGYVHQQPTPAATWVMNHNLGFKPAVALFDAGSQEFDGLITHTSDNQTVATMTAPVAGFARLG